MLGFGPRWNPTDFSSFFILGTCWGQFAQAGDDQLQNGTAKVNMRYMPSGNYLYSLSHSATFSLGPPNIDTSILTAEFMFGLIGNQVLFSEGDVLVVSTARARRRHYVIEM